MPDPFEAIRLPSTPLDPEPGFAARLRGRLERLLALPRDVPTAAPGAVLTPYLAVAGADAALVWYSEAFGAIPSGAPVVMPDGRIGHAELDIAGARLMLSEEHPEIGVVAPVPGKGSSVTIHLGLSSASEVDAAVARAVGAGAAVERKTADYDHGRSAVLRDPFGHRWMVWGPPGMSGRDAQRAPRERVHPSSEEARLPQERARPRPDPSRPRPNPSRPRPGGIAYVSLWVPEAERAATFFSSVLGWRVAPGPSANDRQVEGLGISHGIHGGIARPTLFCCFAVEDAYSTAARIRDAGGVAGEPHLEPYGLVAECSDDQGQAFAVVELPAEHRLGAERLARPSRESALAYVTVEVDDATAARRFLTAVLGWQFVPGSIEDGWQVIDVEPLVGLWGGRERPVTRPMYRVDDIEVAVSRVREAGGSATDPEPQAYGISSDCVDDQGTRFSLGQL